MDDDTGKQFVHDARADGTLTRRGLEDVTFDAPPAIRFGQNWKLRRSTRQTCHSGRRSRRTVEHAEYTQG